MGEVYHILTTQQQQLNQFLGGEVVHKIKRFEIKINKGKKEVDHKKLFLKNRKKSVDKKTPKRYYN